MSEFFYCIFVCTITKKHLHSHIHGPHHVLSGAFSYFMHLHLFLILYFTQFIRLLLSAPLGVGRQHNSSHAWKAHLVKNSSHSTIPHGCEDALTESVQCSGLDTESNPSIQSSLKGNLANWVSHSQLRIRCVLAVGFSLVTLLFFWFKNRDEHL